jgi:hypothetical protein
MNTLFLSFFPSVLWVGEWGVGGRVLSVVPFVYFLYYFSSSIFSIPCPLPSSAFVGGRS